ncbi:MAG TPA: type II secretion system protein [Candidatus Acidoferrum sp.]|jgi:type II secretory pathway pseudopilin PulG|nr:type II secretion system protein [Candidatus Acidoferrum sp.]
MLFILAKQKARAAWAGFTLVEILVALFVFMMVSSGIIYGYVQANRMVQWSSISLAAQSFASQGAEQARAANWNPNGYPMTSNFPGAFDELAPTNEVFSGSNYVLDVPSKGAPGSSDFCFYVTNYVTVTSLSVNPNLRQIRSDAVWRFYLTGTLYTNTTIILRTSNQ